MITVVLGGVATLLGGIATLRQARSTGKKTVVDIYGEALDRLDARQKNTEDKVMALESDLAEAQRHSEKQDREIRTLRAIVHMWAQWGARLHRDWPIVRQQDYAPDLPVVPVEEDGIG